MESLPLGEGGGGGGSVVGLCRIVEKRGLATSGEQDVRNKWRYCMLAMGRTHGVLFAMDVRHKQSAC